MVNDGKIKFIEDITAGLEKHPTDVYFNAGW